PDAPGRDPGGRAGAVGAGVGDGTRGAGRLPRVRGGDESVLLHLCRGGRAAGRPGLGRSATGREGARLGGLAMAELPVVESTITFHLSLNVADLGRSIDFY